MAVESGDDEERASGDVSDDCDSLDTCPVQEDAAADSVGRASSPEQKRSRRETIAVAEGIQQFKNYEVITFSFTFTFGEDSMLSSAEAVIRFGPMHNPSMK